MHIITTLGFDLHLKVSDMACLFDIIRMPTTGALCYYHENALYRGIPLFCIVALIMVHYKA